MPATIVAKTSRAKRVVTRRELEILALVASGRSTAEIARVLWISEETVRTHIRRMHGKLGARTRAHAVAIAFCRGLLTVRRESGEEVPT